MTKKEVLLCSVSLFTILVIFFFIDPIPQDLSYHQFADNRNIFGIPNALNILSNIPLLLIGLLGTNFVIRLLANKGFNAIIIQYLLFFTGLILTSFGSCYYHYHPSNASLFWDRLPMTIVFISLLNSVISELISRKVSMILLPFLLVVGCLSVFYWDWTEKTGQGDLRFYAVVHFLPIVLIFLMLVIYKTPQKYLFYITGLGLFYAVAVVAEFFDQEIFNLLHFASGHTLKHIFASVGCAFILLMLYHRKDSFYQLTSKQS
ncbi:hypothetical protein [Desulfovulcanus sp.]